MLLVLAGLPTLFPKLVEARTFSERMFRVVFLQSLSESESEEAVRRPIDDTECPLRLDDGSVRTVVKMSGGYPYFIQFICREVYDAFSQRYDRGERPPFLSPKFSRNLTPTFFQGDGHAQPIDKENCCL